MASLVFCIVAVIFVTRLSGEGVVGVGAVVVRSWKYIEREGGAVATGVFSRVQTKRESIKNKTIYLGNMITTSFL